MATPLRLANPFHCNGGLGAAGTLQVETDWKGQAARAGAGGYLFCAAARLDCTVIIACRTAVTGR